MALAVTLNEHLSTHHQAGSEDSRKCFLFVTAVTDCCHLLPIVCLLLSDQTYLDKTLGLGQETQRGMP
jgi:hypothetical protein